MTGTRPLIAAVAAFLLALALVGCEAPPTEKAPAATDDVSGVVVYAGTGEPVEGAVVLAQWDVTKGFGHTYHKVVKIEEVVTGKDGRFFISAPAKEYFNKPDVVAYKPGYVAWRNDDIFPSWEKRNDFKFGPDVKVELEVFKEGYSRNQHHGFMSSGIIGANHNVTPMYSEAESKAYSLGVEEIRGKKKRDER